MMPKEVLTDASIRAEVVPGLSLRRICQLLERFEPDDFAADPLPPGGLSAWQQLAVIKQMRAFFCHTVAVQTCCH